MKTWIPFIVLGTLSVSSEATAGDGLRVRTPVTWEDVPCMTIVDRSVDPILHLPYSVLVEDVDLTPDEVPDGRRHQFFAFCRDHDPTDVLPGWISTADVAAAEALSLIDTGRVPDSSILDRSAQWQDCAVRINPDGERRRITFAAADEGVQWDTSGVDGGAWALEGFTYDPALSLWSPRPGVVKVVDDSAIEASGPAAAVITGEELVEVDDTVSIEGCVSAMPGSVLDLRWAKVGTDAWTSAASDVPVTGDAFSYDVSFPPEMIGQAARVQIEVEDPQGRRTTAFMSEFVFVLPASSGCGVGGCETTGGEEGSQSTGEAGESDAESTSGAPDGPAPDGDADSSDVTAGETEDPTGAVSYGASGVDGDGCGCVHDTNARGLGFMLGGLLLFRRRRRPR